MKRAVALVAWATAIVVGGTGAAAALVTADSSHSGLPRVQTFDPPARAGGPSAATPTPRPDAAPVRLQLPTVGVTARIDPVGVNEAGDVAVPGNVRTVGWYRFGPAPGASAGSAVLVGHVDSADRAGAFSRLRDLRRGDRIEVTASGAVRLPYRVVAREQIAKSAIAIEKYFTRAGSPRLTLITCGGAFDRAERSYRDNVVVTAVPA